MLIGDLRTILAILHVETSTIIIDEVNKVCSLELTEKVTKAFLTIDEVLKEIS